MFSQKAKGAPQDTWRANEFGDRQYFHAIGFNRDEYTRIKRDKAYSMGGRRIATYPIYEWRWTRQDCIDYLKRELRVDWAWPKSCCRQCPFAGCNAAGWPEQLARFSALPNEAAQHVIDEYVCLAYVGPNTVHVGWGDADLGMESALHLPEPACAAGTAGGAVRVAAG